MEEETKLRMFLDIELPGIICDATQDCFSCNSDPEASWFVFRKILKEVKKRHIDLYGDFLDSDDDTEIEESEISKHRNKLNTIDK